MTPQDTPDPPGATFARAATPTRESEFGDLESLPWTGITVITAVVALLLFMAVPANKPTAREAIQAQRQRGAYLALEKLRSAIQDYHADHAEWPGLDPSLASSLGPPVYEEAWLRRQLEMCSNATGATVPSAGAEFTFGPYLQNGIPVNPHNRLDSIRILFDGESFEGVVDRLYGWVYDPRSGEVRPHLLPFQLPVRESVSSGPEKLKRD